MSHPPPKYEPIYLEPQGRAYSFRLGWHTVRGSACPITTIIEDEPEEGIERQTWHHVLRLRIHHGILSSAIRWLRDRLPAALQRYITRWFPAAFLPETVIVKEMKEDWEEEFDNEIAVYDKLKPLQGSVIPVFYGEAVVEEGTRAMLLSDVGGTPLARVPPSKCRPEDVARMLETSIRAIFGLGLAPFDAHLLNCLVTHDGRIVLVDHELNEELNEEMKGQMEELIQTEVESLVEEWLKVHTPKKARDVGAVKRANEAWLARNSHALAIHPLG